MVKSLSFYRIINYILLRSGYLLSRLTGSLFLWGKPISLSIEISGNCQLHCPECPLGNGKHNQRTLMSYELFASIIEQNKKHLWMVSLYFQGEPLLHPAIGKFITLLKKHRIYTSVSTNGNFDNPSLAEKLVQTGLDELIVSVDGADQESYASYRKGGSLMKAMAFMQNIRQAKKQSKKNRPRLIMQSIIMRQNERSLTHLKTIAKQAEATLRLKSMQIINLNQTDSLPENPKLGRYNITDGRAMIKNPLRNHCWRVFRNPVITSHGDVLPCCFDKAGKYKMGNVQDIPFLHIWHSGAYRTFVKKVFTERKKTDICTNCTEGTKSIYV
ncbi:MAG: radical SAM/SPASM domain-containing protein [Bacteroidales bacterium]